MPINNDKFNPREFDPEDRNSKGYSPSNNEPNTAPISISARIDRIDDDYLHDNYEEYADSEDYPGFSNVFEREDATSVDEKKPSNILGTSLLLIGFLTLLVSGWFVIQQQIELNTSWTVTYPSAMPEIALLPSFSEVYLWSIGLGVSGIIMALGIILLNGLPKLIKGIAAVALLALTLAGGAYNLNSNLNPSEDTPAIQSMRKYLIGGGMDLYQKPNVGNNYSISDSSESPATPEDNGGDASSWDWIDIDYTFGNQLTNDLLRGKEVDPCFGYGNTNVEEKLSYNKDNNIDQENGKNSVQPNPFKLVRVTGDIPGIANVEGDAYMVETTNGSYLQRVIDENSGKETKAEDYNMPMSCPSDFSRSR